MKCDFCQNWHISQKSDEGFSDVTDPVTIAGEAVNSVKNAGLAFTYNEPVIWFEFMRDTALKIKEKGLFTVMVSNGFVNREPLYEIIGFIDAFNIDLKAFNEPFYKKMTGARLEPVKESLRQIVKAGKHLEITSLIIPGRNDSIDEMEAESKWISDELGNETPFHLSRYFPMYKRNDPPTPQATLTRLFETASVNLKYVYMGNTPGDAGQNTHCSRCGKIVTKRTGYNTRLMNLDQTGRCSECGNQIYRYFILPSRADR
jgi:pyruvate formate lyase activating enzyme